jgi:hypothetical protein
VNELFLIESEQNPGNSQVGVSTRPLQRRTEMLIHISVKTEGWARTCEPENAIELLDQAGPVLMVMAKRPFYYATHYSEFVFTEVSKFLETYFHVLEDGWDKNHPKRIVGMPTDYKAWEYYKLEWIEGDLAVEHDENGIAEVTIVHLRVRLTQLHDSYNTFGPIVYELAKAR